MSDELKAAKILFIIAAVLSFLGSLFFIAGGIIAITTGFIVMDTIGWLMVAGGVFLGITGGIKVWCGNLVKNEEKLTTAGVLGIIFGILPGDILSLIAGILILVKKHEDEKSSKGRKKSSKKKPKSKK